MFYSNTKTLDYKDKRENMNKLDALREINETQDFYVDKLSDILLGVDNSYKDLKEIDFTSPTGTGKTVMVARLINKFPDYFFVITTLSRGQLKYQIETKLRSLVKNNNFKVFGLSDYTKSTILQADDIINCLPENRKIIWIRDEGHIATNKWQEVLRIRSSLIINFSATNKSSNGIQCNFVHTMMLRSVIQNSGTPEEALDKLLEVKKIHQMVKDYNPCALFRIIHDENLKRVIDECEKRGLTYINVTDENYDMSDICKDNNSFDVIINKFKITEGIDLKRCHVIYMDSKPSNEATTIQVIGRARRNALFWREDIDIMNDSNKELLEETRHCYIFYNIPSAQLAQNEVGELMYSLCDTISVEALRPGIEIYVDKGRLLNGLYIFELLGETGTFRIFYDWNLRVNFVKNDEFYRQEKIHCNQYLIDLTNQNYNLKKIYLKSSIVEFFKKNNLRSSKEKDIFKYTFYLIKLYSQKKGIDLNLDYWEEYLRVDEKKFLIGEQRYGKFYNDKIIHDFWRKEFVPNSKEFFSQEEIDEANKFAQVDTSPIYSEKKDIFVVNYEGYTFLKQNLYKYIDTIELLNTFFAEEINLKLRKIHNLKQVSNNNYLYSPHPFTVYLETKGISNLSVLRKKLSKVNGKSFLGCHTEYWNKMLKEINNFEDIDKYDIQYISLSDFNKRFRLGYSMEQISDYANGIYRLEKGVSPENDLKILTFKNHLPVPTKCKSFVIYKREFEGRYQPYEKVINDYEIASIGSDTMKYVGGSYIEDRAVTSKITKFCKFNRFITDKYERIINSFSKDFFVSRNVFPFDKKCNSCLGFCVEYFAKIKLYGEMLYEPYINTARIEAKINDVTDAVKVRAAILIYKDEMKRCYGQQVAGLIPSFSISQLINDNFSLFVKTVVELGNKAADYVLNTLYDGEISNVTKFYDPNLSVNHISALCDFISSDTIIDLKCTSSIAEKHLKQILSYYYLSTKRSDLKIKKLIVYDVPTGREIRINIDEFTD